MKLTKRLAILPVIAVTLLQVFSPFVDSASAADSPATWWYDAAATAEMKIIGKAFFRCVELFQTNKQGKFNAPDAQKGDIFIDDADGDLRAQGLLLETYVSSSGSYDDFIITCKENGSKLASLFSSNFGVDMQTITCGPFEGNKGVLYRPDDKKECSSYSNNAGGDYEFSDVATRYAKKLYAEGFAKKNTGNKLYYGDGDVLNLAKINSEDYNPAEKYYIFRKTFERYCGYEDEGGTTTIAYVGTNGSVLEKKFTYKNSGTVQVYQTYSTTCSELAGQLKKGGDLFKAARTLEQQKINLGCRDGKKYQETLEKKRDELMEITGKGVGEEFTQDQIDLAKSQLDTIYSIIGGDGKAGSKNFTQYIDADDQDKGWNCLQLADLGLTASIVTGATDMSDAVVQPNCYNSGGAVSWILCPVINIVNDAGKLMWEQVRNNLVIDSGLLQNGGDGVYKAWETFRTIANIILIILFLIVIISQLTGVGINNYGIKKVLPRIIIVAVLINTSFIICQLAVDVSNIIGTNLNLMLESIVPYTDPQDFTSGDGTGASAFFAWISAILLGGAGGILLAGGIGPLLGLIAMALIMGVLAILVLFVLLAIRQAGVVILIALAPVAFACFVLPNTEKIFKKWLDLFKMLLLLFPLAALLVGGATMASNIMLNSATQENSIMMLLAFVLPAMSYFFIPTMLKSSMAGLGNIGAKLSGIGSRMGRNIGGRAQRATNKGFDNSAAGQRLNTWRAGRKTNAEFKKNQKTIDKITGKLNDGKSITDTQKTMLFNANKAQANLGDEVGLSNLMKDWNGAFNRGDSAKLKELSNRGQQLYGFKFAAAAGKTIRGNNISPESMSSLSALKSFANEGEGTVGAAFKNDLAGQAIDSHNYLNRNDFSGKKSLDSVGNVSMKDFGNMHDSNGNLINPGSAEMAKLVGSQDADTVANYNKLQREAVANLNVASPAHEIVEQRVHDATSEFATNQAGFAVRKETNKKRFIETMGEQLDIKRDNGGGGGTTTPPPAAAPPPSA